MWAGRAVGNSSARSAAESPVKGGPPELLALGEGSRGLGIRRVYVAADTQGPEPVQAVFRSATRVGGEPSFGVRSRTYGIHCLWAGSRSASGWGSHSGASASSVAKQFLGERNGSRLRKPGGGEGMRAGAKDVFGGDVGHGRGAWEETSRARPGSPCRGEERGVEGVALKADQVEPGQAGESRAARIRLSVREAAEIPMLSVLTVTRTPFRR